MDILGIGTDIVECLRIGRMIERHGELFLKRVYTANEIRYCQRRKRALDHFAARWAGKEAVFKALGMGVRRGLDWTDVEIRSDELGKPQVLLCGATREFAKQLRVADIYLSLSHCRAYATAYALAVREGPSPAG
jgi:holo-[acyl-carrier protein] synthase